MAGNLCKTLDNPACYSENIVQICIFNLDLSFIPFGSGLLCIYISTPTGKSEQWEKKEST